MEQESLLNSSIPENERQKYDNYKLFLKFAISETLKNIPEKREYTYSECLKEILSFLNKVKENTSKKNIFCDNFESKYSLLNELIGNLIEFNNLKGTDQQKKQLAINHINTYIKNFGSIHTNFLSNILDQILKIFNIHISTKTELSLETIKETFVPYLRSVR